MTSRLPTTQLAALPDSERADFWIERIEQLDRVLRGPALSLIELVHDALRKGPEREGSFTVRTRITETQEEPYAPSLLIHAVACAAIQRLHQEKRRFPWLGDVGTELKELREWMPAHYTNHPKIESENILEVIQCLDDPLFGTLSPLTASEVFWLLIRAGEGSAHGTVGFLALFSLLWALKRRLGSFNAGAALGRWRPTVAVTARCLLPILKLNEILAHRASVFRRLRETWIDLRNNEQGRNQYERWSCAASLDRLAAWLHDLARLSIRAADFEAAGRAMTRLASPIDHRTATLPLVRDARAAMRELLIQLGAQNRGILVKAEYATASIQPRLIELLKAKSPGLRDQCKLDVSDWTRQIEAAEEANAISCDALAELQKAVSISEGLAAESELTHERLIETIEQLAQINDRVRNILRSAVEENIEWCERAVGREVAYASSGNDTDFDAAELLSGIEIAEWVNRTSRAQVADAIRQSLRVARGDGSWATGQPIFLEKRVLGVWPGTPDLMLLLSSVVRPHERLHDADEHLLHYVDWLEARLFRVRPHGFGTTLTGWQSETRESGIAVWSTATSIRALLEIREIFEDRLWELCEDRFTILRKDVSVHGLDPVDLGARHDQRLQRRLFRMTSDTLHRADRAEYAFVLHGPPGSSKSAVAEAIGNESWRVRRETRMPERPPRFVRITPADFTRRGQEGLDFEARFIFRLLSHVRRVTILFDEIDDLLRNRAVGTEPTFIRLVIPGMLNRLQDLRDAAQAQEIVFLLATNYIDQIEPALTRPGRLDGAIPVPYPDPWSRESILERIAGKKGVAVPDEVKTEVVGRTGEWPWTTYQKMCKRLVESLTMDDAERELQSARATLQQQSPEYYYRNPLRWRASSPLVNELVHFGFGISKDPQECRRRIAEIVDGKTVERLKIMDHFRAEWDREHRG